MGFIPAAVINSADINATDHPVQVVDKLEEAWAAYHKTLPEYADPVELPPLPPSPTMLDGTQLRWFTADQMREYARAAIAAACAVSAEQKAELMRRADVMADWRATGMQKKIDESRAYLLAYVEAL